MAKRKSSQNQLNRNLPEYGELIDLVGNEAAAMWTDYIRQYVGSVNALTPQPGSGIYINFDRVLQTQTWKELYWYDMYAEVERDPHVQAVLESAKLNVAGMPYSIEPFVADPKKNKKPESRDVSIAEFVQYVLDGVGYFPQHLYDLLSALGMGFSVSEIVWDPRPEGVFINRIMNRPQRRFQFDAVTRQLKLRDIQQPYYGIPLPEKKFIVHRCRAQWENPFGDALDQSIYWMWLFKKTVLKFSMQHLQTGASSVPIVEHPSGANDDLKAEAMAIAQTIRNGAYGRIPNNFKLLWAESKNALTNTEAYNSTLRFFNDEISKLVNGQTLTTEGSSGEGKGTRSLGQVHQIAQSARDVFRAKGLSATLNATIIKWIVDFNFSDVKGYPSFRFDLEDPEDLQQESVIVKNLSDAGYEIDVAELSDKFNYSISKKSLSGAIPEPIVGQ